MSGRRATGAVLASLALHVALALALRAAPRARSRSSPMVVELVVVRARSAPPVADERSAALEPARTPATRGPRRSLVLPSTPAVGAPHGAVDPASVRGGVGARGDAPTPERPPGGPDLFAPAAL